MRRDEVLTLCIEAVDGYDVFVYVVIFIAANYKIIALIYNAEKTQRLSTYTIGIGSGGPIAPLPTVLYK